MIKKVLEVTRDFLWWARSGVAPSSSVGTATEEQDANINHFRSRKFTIAFVCLLLVFLLFLVAVGFLFLLPQYAITAFVSIFDKTTGIVALIVSVLISAQGLVDLRWNHQSNTTVSGNIDYKKEDINIYEHIVEEGVNGPNLKPFAQHDRE